VVTHRPSTYGRAFTIGVTLNMSYVIIEFVDGRLSHSLALVTDAAHNLSDVLGLLLAWGAAVLATRIPSTRRIYGLRRSSILVALTSAIILLVAIGAIAWEAIRRLSSAAEVAGGTVIVVAIGVVVNMATALLFMSGRKGDLNIRGAFLHMAADAGVSLGVVLTGIILLFVNWTWLDPIVSLAIVAVILIGMWGLLRDSVNLALDAVPEGVNPEEVHADLAAVPGVTEVHDLHIWAMSTTENALTAHLVMPNAAQPDAILSQVRQALHDRFEIEHATVQIEHGDPAYPCHMAPAEVV
jgi:cobalt-zinc-cadmium efflux system protein